MNLLRISKFSKIIILSLALTFFLQAKFTFASEKFLTLPFTEYPKLMQGWNYSGYFGGMAHQGIDYYASMNTDIISSADGLATKYYQGFPPDHSYGNFIIVDQGNGFKALYAHLASIDPKITKGTPVKRGEVIGKSGMTGTDNPHLHFEALSNYDNGKGFNKGYGWRYDPYDIYSVAAYYPPSGSKFTNCGENNLWKNGCPPSLFIILPKTTLTIANTDSESAKLSWTKPEIKNFKKYEIYRSTEAGGTSDPAKRTLIVTIENPDTLEFTDTGLSPDTEYFYSIFSYDQYDNFSQSDEASTKTQTGVKNITQNPYNQRYPDITERYVTWDDSRINEDTRRRDPYLYTYDITEDKIKTFDLRIAGSAAPATTSIYKNKVAYEARKSSNPYYGDQNIYYFDIERDGGTGVFVTEASGNQINPDIYENLIVWEDQSLSGNFNLYYIDLNATDGPRELVTDPYHQMLPKIWQDKVVYVDVIAGQTGSYKIMMIDVNTKEKTVLSENMAYGHPYIDQGKVVWEKGDVIYIYDIATKQTETLALKDAVTPIVSQGKVVYQANDSIFIYNIQTRKTDTIVSGLTWQADYDLENGYLVYTDHTEYDTLASSFMDVLMVKVG